MVQFLSNRVAALERRLLEVEQKSKYFEVEDKELDSDSYNEYSDESYIEDEDPDESYIEDEDPEESDFSDIEDEDCDYYR
jgi:hypothetical protein